MSRPDQTTSNWPELAIGLYDKLTGRGAEITYEMDNLEVMVPGAVGSTDQARWMLNGTVRISTQDRKVN